MGKIKVTLNTPNVFKCEGVQLIAGENKVDEADLDRFFANKHCLAALEDGRIAIGETYAKRFKKKYGKKLDEKTPDPKEGVNPQELSDEEQAALEAAKKEQAALEGGETPPEGEAGNEGEQE